MDIESGTKRSETSSLISGVKKGFFSKASDVQNQVTQAIDTGTNYYAFLTFFVIGCMFLLLALTFLPLILVTPAKFNLFFSLGSLFLQLALTFFHGPLAYLKMLFKKENIIIASIYFAAVGMSVYASLFWGTYLSSLCFIAI